jgi:hypothetical protein
MARHFPQLEALGMIAVRISSAPSSLSSSSPLNTMILKIGFDLPLFDIAQERGGEESGTEREWGAGGGKARDDAEWEANDGRGWPAHLNTLRKCDLSPRLPCTRRRQPYLRQLRPVLPDASTPHVDVEQILIKSNSPSHDLRHR